MAHQHHWAIQRYSHLMFWENTGQKPN